MKVKFIGCLTLLSFNWVFVNFVKFILVNTTLSLYFLNNINYFNSVSINSYELCNSWFIPEK